MTDVTTIEEFFVTNRDSQEHAGSFTIEKPKYHTITNNHKCGIEVINTTPGWYHIPRHNDIHVYFTADKKKYKLIGVGAVKPGYIFDGDFLCSLINNQITTIFINYFKHVHLHEMIGLGNGYTDIKFVYDKKTSTKDDTITVKLSSFQYHGKTYYPHIVLGYDLERMTGYHSYHPEHRHFRLSTGIVTTTPDLKYDFIDLRLMCNFTDTPLMTFINISGRNFDTVWYSDYMHTVTNPNVDKLEFWFETERGEIIKNELGMTIIHLRFTRE